MCALYLISDRKLAEKLTRGDSSNADHADVFDNDSMRTVIVNQAEEDVNNTDSEVASGDSETSSLRV